MKTTFWDTDLDVLEASFLPKGKKITDLNVSFDARVPVQGGVLLERMFNVDQTVKSPSLISRLIHSVFKRDLHILYHLALPVLKNVAVGG